MEPFDCVGKKWALAHLKMLPTNYVYRSYKYSVYIYREDFTLNVPQCLICLNQPIDQLYDHVHICQMKTAVAMLEIP